MFDNEQPSPMTIVEQPERENFQSIVSDASRAPEGVVADNQNALLDQVMDEIRKNQVNKIGST